MGRHEGYIYNVKHHHPWGEGGGLIGPSHLEFVTPRAGILYTYILWNGLLQPVWFAYPHAYQNYLLNSIQPIKFQTNPAS